MKRTKIVILEGGCLVDENINNLKIIDLDELDSGTCPICGGNVEKIGGTEQSLKVETIVRSTKDGVVSEKVIHTFIDEGTVGGEDICERCGFNWTARSASVVEHAEDYFARTQ